MKAWEAKNWCVVRIYGGFYAFGGYAPPHVVEEYFDEFADAYKVFQAWKVLNPQYDVRIYELHRGTSCSNTSSQSA